MHHVIIHQYDPDIHVAGGTEGFIRDLVRHAGPSHRFSLIGVTGAGTGTRKLGRWAQVDIGTDATVDFMPVARIPAARMIPHTMRLVGGFFRFRPRFECDIVHFHRVETAALCAKVMSCSPYVQFLHGAGQAHHWGGRESFWRFSPTGYDQLERRAVSGSLCTYIMDRRKAETMKKQFPQVRHGENWYDDAIFRPAQADVTSDEPVIGWVGRLEESKDPLLALHVFEALRAGGLRFEAWMAGDGPLRGLVENEVQMRGLDNVRLAGLLTADDLADRLRGTMVCLATSRWEGIPRALIEALACGVPVVTTDVGDMRYIVRPGAGYVVEQRAETALASAVEAALEDGPSAETAASVTQWSVGCAVPRLLGNLEHWRA